MFKLPFDPSKVTETARQDAERHANNILSVIRRLETPSAGRAYREAVEASGGDLQAVRATLQSIFDSHRDRLEAAIDGYHSSNDELEARGFPRVDSIEALEQLALIVEIPRHEIGGLTYRDIFNEALAWHKRLKIQKAMEAGCPAQSTNDHKGPSAPGAEPRSQRKGLTEAELISSGYLATSTRQLRSAAELLGKRKVSGGGSADVARRARSAGVILDYDVLDMPGSKGRIRSVLYALPLNPGSRKAIEEAAGLDGRKR
jgi:hypothetical protein